MKNITKKIITLILTTGFLTISTGLAKVEKSKIEIKKETKKETRSSGKYSCVIEYDSSALSSLIFKQGKKQYLIPKGLFEDIKNPHLGKGFAKDDFRIEVKDRKFIIRIKAGDKKLFADHAWIMPLPLKNVRRITRRAEITGYHEAHPSTALESAVIRAK